MNREHFSLILLPTLRCNADCTYCFGCVGLSKKDFHILNVGFSRQEYFELTKRLKKELNVR